MGSQRRVNETIRTQATVPYLQNVTQTDIIHRGGQDCHKEQLGTPYIPINAPQDQKIHSRGLTASAKSHL